DEREKSELLLDLLTPVIKSWSSEVGVKANDLAIQVLGGAGYTREYPVEQYWRDNRLNPIHEGTNGIQALDLVGRKLWQRNSKGLQVLVSKVNLDLSRAKESSERLQAWAQTIEEHLSLVHRVTMQLGADLQKESPDLTLSNASSYLSMFARVVVSWLWLRQALAAEKGIAETEPANHEELSFYRGKLQAAQYYIKWQLPLAKHEADLLLGRDDTCFEMQPNWF
ncbi:acyl-CoA dehydrogenase C-terminal domain-containing protein, partial [Oleiphilus sp. HI0043]|uniref:acyl-CoA dehydrogenase C-terminal domain-containing protein n=8 Tax=Oleiphilus TaxID=141450 RepID=UPI000A53DED5